MTEINHIAQLANNRGKLSKARFWSVVREIIAGSRTDSAYELDQLADLYNFFKPVPGKQPKSAVEWVAQAMAKNDVRGYLNNICSDGKRIIGCDGHRAHIFTTPKYKPGYYDSQMNLIADDIASYPNIDRVIPKGKGKRFKKTALLSGEIRMIESRGKPVEAIGLLHGFANHLYVRDALSFFNEQPNHDPITAFQSDERGAIRYNQGMLEAVVMPVRVD